MMRDQTTNPDQVSYRTCSKKTRQLSIIICPKVSITKLSHSWYDAEFFIYSKVNLRRDDFQRWETFANTMYTLWCLHKYGANIKTWEYRQITLPIQILLTTLLTDMRFKNNIWASGTPFCMSNSIAWLAELPSLENISNIQPLSIITYKSANNQLYPNK